MASTDTHFLSQPQDGQDNGFIDWGDYKIYYFCQKNQGKSPQNEDVVFASAKDQLACFGVADGVGGAPKGAEAAQIAAQTLLDGYSKGSPPPLSVILEEMNRSIRELKVGASTTLAFVRIDHHFASFTSIGDSEILLTQNRGQIRYSNIPHSPVGHAVEAGLLEQGEALDSPERHLVSNLLGDEIFYYESSSKIELKKGHSILIGSDGLFDNIPQNKLADMISSGVFEESAEQLAKLCAEASNNKNWKKDDDISFIFLRRLRA